MSKSFRSTLCTLRIVHCELLYIELNRQIGAELDSIAFGQQDRVRGKGVADLPQCLAQATAGHGVRHIWPEGASQQVAGVGPVAIGDQVGKERPGRRARDGQQRPIIPVQSQSAQKMDA